MVRMVWKLWPRSLKQRLIAHLLVLQFAVLLAFGLSFVTLLVVADEGGALVSPTPVETAFRAIKRGVGGKLELADTASNHISGSSRAATGVKSSSPATCRRSTAA